MDALEFFAWCFIIGYTFGSFPFAVWLMNRVWPEGRK